jgi:hypothetical protein
VKQIFIPGCDKSSTIISEGEINEMESFIAVLSAPCVFYAGDL